MTDGWQDSTRHLLQSGRRCVKLLRSRLLEKTRGGLDDDATTAAETTVVWVLGCFASLFSLLQYLLSSQT